MNMKLKQQLVTIGNTAYRVLFNDLSQGVKLTRDSGVRELIKLGYEENHTVFSIGMKLADMFASIPVKCYKGENEIDDPRLSLFENNLADFTLYEYNVMWHMFGLMTGESIEFYTRLGMGGNNNGLIKDLVIIPSQNVEIESNGWREPVGKYKIDLDDGYFIAPENILHTRFFPNLDFTGGKNFRGISPLKVARKLIEAENNGVDLISQMSGSGLPPGILYEKGKTERSNLLQNNNLINVWRKKFGNRKRKAEPIIRDIPKDGEVGWIPIGFSNIQDLQIIENSKDGLRKLCFIWQIPSRLANDAEGGTYNNLKTDEKRIYTNRLIPDMNRRLSGLNKMYSLMGIRFEADYSQIESLQEDRKDIISRLTLGYDRGLVDPNEWRIAAGLEELTPQELEELRLMIAESRGSYPVVDDQEQKKLAKYLGYE